MAKTGVLLLNIGSTKSPHPRDVASYLRNFLMDKEVINLPWLLRWVLVNFLIVPRRAKKSAANYQKIWLPEGSPLDVHSRAFAQSLQKYLGSGYVTQVGMRYSQPSIKEALKKLREQNISELLIVPLYPQFADATSLSSINAVHRELKSLKWTLPVKTYPAFFDSPAFVQASSAQTQERLQGREIDHYLFSFHGLPEEHIRKIQGCRLDNGCCFTSEATQKNCYRAQCYATAKAIAGELHLLPNQWSVSFQSRLGSGEWLKPSTDDSLEILASTHKKNIAVLCPSFVADCIETLEEIGIGGEEFFREKGGGSLTLIPCVNAHPLWSEGFSREIQAFTK